MKRAVGRWSLYFVLFVFLGCSTKLAQQPITTQSAQLKFTPEIALGRPEANPSTPFLRFSPDGRLFAVWTEDHDTPWPAGKPHPGHRTDERRPRAIADAQRIHRFIQRRREDLERGETGQQRHRSRTRRRKWAEIGFRPRWKNLRRLVHPRRERRQDPSQYSLCNGRRQRRLHAARTLNEVQDAGRFPIIETTPDGNLLIAWIDRRIDNPKPRQFYLMKIDYRGQALTKNYQAGEGLCECCKLGIEFADGGKTVYMVDREVDANKIRNHVLRKSTDGGATFGAPDRDQQRRLASPFLPAFRSEYRPRQPWPTTCQLVHPGPIGTRGRNLLQCVETTTAKLSRRGR